MDVKEIDAAVEHVKEKLISSKKLKIVMRLLKLVHLPMVIKKLGT